MTQPLAARLRPRTLQQVVGQEHITENEGLLARLIAAQTPQSLILWGPPGCGKTTLAQLYATAFGADFVQLSAVLAGVADVRKVVEQAHIVAGLGRKTVLFVDEIHRFNKAQQDAFLPHVESGLLTLVGATTENPSFALNNALLSRAQVLVLNALDAVALEKVLAQAEAEVGPLPLDVDARQTLLHMSHGDARSLLNMVETIVSSWRGSEADVAISREELIKRLPTRMANYDKGGDWHYDVISALHKSVRGSDPDAALYYLARMLEGGEDGMYLARRLIRMAVEDIGLADPQALPLAVAAQDAYRTMGSPEGDLALAEVAVYLALAPKSIGVYEGWNAAKTLAKQTSELVPPKHIVNAPTKMMKELGHGEGYQYDPHTADGFSGQNYFPTAMAERPSLYKPVERGFEREMVKRMEYFAKLRAKKSKG